ncbi:MAG: formimidoylglutamate deiminase [Acidobacteria bacterium]|nr:formimidoylglutamate deiminase [Acidobacteriota bacterium]
MSEPLKQDDAGGATVTWMPDLIYVNGRFERDMALACDAGGRILALLPLGDLRELLGGRIPENETLNVTVPERGIIFATRFVRLPGRALLPGLVNAHSHAFQRVIRGRTEHRGRHRRDSFWTWREEMYSAAARLTPEDIYDASRMAFMEMSLGGITAAGEFHYIHRTPEGEAYDDANLLAKQVVRAARDCGLRVALLRVAYARSGFGTPPNERQKRFIEPDVETYLRHVETLRSDLAAPDDNHDATSAWVGVAPHSVRAVPLRYLRAVSEFAAARELPLHIHVAEQPAEVSACLAETERTPVALLADNGLLNSRFTAVHALHVTPEEIRTLRDARANVCACPTTERNLGDGIVPADLLFAEGVPVALGTDSHTQIDLLEDARELEYHLRLSKLERNVLAPASVIREELQGDASAGRGDATESASESNISALAARLFECATANGARSIGAAGGELAPGRPADFFTVDLNDPSIAGANADDLLPAVVFSLARTAIREVFVGGQPVVEDGRHHAQDEIVSRFAALQRKLWK